jgi:hypothetical protein
MSKCSVGNTGHTERNGHDECYLTLGKTHAVGVPHLATASRFVIYFLAAIADTMLEFSHWAVLYSRTIERPVREMAFLQ